jgi:hypothetical protein
MLVHALTLDTSLSGARSFCQLAISSTHTNLFSAMVHGSEVDLILLLTGEKVSARFSVFYLQALNFDLEKVFGKKAGPARLVDRLSQRQKMN